MTKADGPEAAELPCGSTVNAWSLDLGIREYTCSCGDNHAVVMGSHPPTRFLPEEFIEILRETVETADAFEQFGTPHLIGLVMDEYPECVTTIDTGDIGSVGHSIVWMTTFDARELHEIIVELVVDMMNHAMTHASEDPQGQFVRYLNQFDIEEFVDEYREKRNFTNPSDAPV